LEDVLFAFRAQNERPSREAVEHWTARYPQFATEIREAAALWAESNVQETVYRPSREDESLVAEARSRALNALHRSSATQPPARVPRNLGEAVRQAGTTVAEISRQISLPTSVVSKVIRSKIMGATIPDTFTRMVARLLGREVDWVRGCYPPGIAAAYGSNGATGITASTSVELTFQEAVTEAFGMSDEQRRFWLDVV
jgi:hypothetical protein